MTRARLPGLDAADPRLAREIRDKLSEVEVALEKTVRADYELLGQAASHLINAGGKRFRPMLVLLCGHFGDRTDPRLVAGAVTMELTHVATLYHDDVMDEARVRHGVASVNARWNNTIAILTGDYLFAKVSELSADLGPDVTRLLARTIATVCDGQVRDVSAAGSLSQSEEDYMETIRRKTASLIATSCRLGGLLSDCPPDVVERLDDFGSALGMAFQLSDDIMDVVASEEDLGKPPGQDLRQGVFTLPVLHALRDVGGAELADLIRGGPLDGPRLERALAIARSESSLEHARIAVTAQVRRASGIADGLAPGRAREGLRAIAEFLARRCGAAV